MSQDTQDNSSCTDSDDNTDDDSQSPVKMEPELHLDHGSPTNTDTTSSDEELGEEEEEDLLNIDESITRKAAMNNLSQNVVKDIIKTLVSNDQVLAICKLRAEEIERHKEEGKSNFKKQLLFDSPDGVKLTRNRARELNHSITSTLPALDLKAIEPDEDVVKLVEKDFSDEDGDESDDEYNPKDDEADLSDDYSTATCSDIESQPRTPGDALIVSEADDSPNKSSSEVQYDDEGVFKVPVEKKSPLKAEEMVAKRTRSKISLTETPIETIQKKFIHTDLFPDMYALPEDMEGDEPWKEFLEQFQNPLGEDKEKEDENDPDYVAKSLQTGGDDSRIKVTKREVQSLIDELLVGFEESFNPDFPNDLEIESLKASFSVKSTSAVDQPSTSFQPCDPVQEMTANQSIVEYYAGEYEAPEIDDQDQVFIEPLAILNPAPTFDNNLNMILGSDNKLYLVPRSVVTGEEEEGPQPEEEEEIDGELSIGGWTRKTIGILHRQLLIHIQLAGQLFTHTYSHPEVWKLARNFKDMIEELVELAKKETTPFLSVLCWNLSDMSEICIKWQQDLDVESKANRQYVRDQVEYKELMKQVRRFFPTRLAELWITNRAFMFGEYLPNQVAIKRVSKQSYVPGEFKLLAMLLAESNVTSNKKKTKKGVSRRAVADLYERKYNKARISDKISFLMTSAVRKSSTRSNPVEAYCNRGEVPVITHEELKLKSYDDVVLLSHLPRNTLSYRWNQFVYSTSTKKFDRPTSPGTILISPTKFLEREKKNKEKQQQETQKTTSRKRNTIRPPTTITEKPLQPVKRLTLPTTPKPKKKQQIAGRILPNPQQKPSKPPKSRNPTRVEVEALKRLIDRVRKQENRCPSLDPIRRRKVLTRKLHNLLQTTDEEYDGRMKSLNGNLISTKIFHYFKEFDLFVRLLFAWTQKPNDWIEDTPEMRGITNSINSKDHSLLLQTSAVTVVESKDQMFAWTFISQVEEKIKKRKAAKKFDEFMEIIKDLDLKRHRVEEFYLKLEEMFLNSDAELIECFLEYLLPNHANQLGRFIHRLMKRNSGSLRKHLEIYMDRQKEQLETVYEVLNELSSGDGISMSRIKKSFQVLLRGNPLLESWFLQLFPKVEEDRGDSEGDSLEHSLKLESSIVIPGYLVQLLRQLEEIQAHETTQLMEVANETLGGDKNSPIPSTSNPRKRKGSDRKSAQKKRRVVTGVEIVKESPEKGSVCPDSCSWTRDEDQLLFTTINGLTDCPEDKVMKVLWDIFPAKNREDVVKRFYEVVELMKSFV